ncbi:MAG: UPF0147 family protein [Thermoplasmata archaeon]
MDEMEQMLNETIKMMDDLMTDYSIPRNVRKNIQTIRNKLATDKTSLDVRAASSVISLDELVNDPNMPGHARTVLYMVMSKLEILQKKASHRS